MPILVCLSDSVRLSIHEKYEILEGAEKYFKRKKCHSVFSSRWWCILVIKIGKWVYIPFKVISRE